MSSQYRAHNVARKDRADCSIILRCKDSLPTVVDRTTDWLDKWATETPAAVFLAERSGKGWFVTTYIEAQQQAKALAAGLLDLGREAPSIAVGETTAKGNINFRKLLTHRAVLVDRLYDDNDDATILIYE